MKPTITVIRAVGVRFIRQAIKPWLWCGAGLAIVLVSGGAWLTTYSAWWWILEVLFIGGSLFFVTLVVCLGVILRIADPSQSPEQKQAVTAFVTKLQHASEQLRTPQPLIVYRVVRDIMNPHTDSFIATTAHDSKALASELADLHRLFR